VLQGDDEKTALFLAARAAYEPARSETISARGHFSMQFSKTLFSEKLDVWLARFRNNDTWASRLLFSKRNLEIDWEFP
jgi:hypothetical protein